MQLSFVEVRSIQAALGFNGVISWLCSWLVWQIPFNQITSEFKQAGNLLFPIPQCVVRSVVQTSPGQESTQLLWSDAHNSLVGVACGTKPCGPILFVAAWCRRSMLSTAFRRAHLEETKQIRRNALLAMKCSRVRSMKFSIRGTDGPKSSFAAENYPQNGHLQVEKHCSPSNLGKVMYAKATTQSNQANLNKRAGYHLQSAICLIRNFCWGLGLPEWTGQFLVLLTI